MQVVLNVSVRLKSSLTISSSMKTSSANLGATIEAFFIRSSTLLKSDKKEASSSKIWPKFVLFPASVVFVVSEY